MDKSDNKIKHNIMNIYQKLQGIQKELKAPKSQFNKFGGYKYRKAEDILEAVKPLLDKYGCVLLCTDELETRGDRFYVKATATLCDCESDNLIMTQAYAREEDTKKGMDGSQITGASSSYARKYALNGLLCIDDTADSDTTNTGDDTPKPAPKKSAPKKVEAQPQEVDRETYFKFVRAYAEGKTTKSGGDLKERWIQMVNATPEMVAEFDKNVAEYKAALNGEEI